MRTSAIPRYPFYSHSKSILNRLNQWIEDAAMLQFIINTKILVKKNEIMKKWRLGSGTLSGKMFLVKIVENNKIDANFREG